MSMQTPADLARLRALLQAEIDRMSGRLKDMEETSRRAMETEGARPGFGKRVGDYTAGAVEAASNSALARNLGQSMDEMRRAIEKIDEGTYGLCDRCHQPIAPERLDFLPSATLCIECKRQSEHSLQKTPKRPPTRRRG